MRRWDYWRPVFEQLIDQRFYTAEWLDGEVRSGRIRLIDNADAAILVTVKTYPTGATELHGMAAAGALDAVVEVLIPRAEAWGRAQGCAVATIESREGWIKVLRPHGFAVHQTALRKEL